MLLVLLLDIWTHCIRTFQAIGSLCVFYILLFRADFPSTHSGDYSRCRVWKMGGTWIPPSLQTALMPLLMCLLMLWKQQRENCSVFERIPHRLLRVHKWKYGKHTETPCCLDCPNAMCPHKEEGLMSHLNSYLHMSLMSWIGNDHTQNIQKWP